MRSWIIKATVGVLAIAIVLVFALVKPDQSKAIATPAQLPPLHAGIGSPGAVPNEEFQEHENPEFFAIVKTDWPLLGIAEPRTAWEKVQYGAYLQDDLEMEEEARLMYEEALHDLEIIAERENDPALPERMLQAHFRLGPIYLRRNENFRAIEHFEAILHEDPEAEGLNREIAIAFEHLAVDALHDGDRDAAAEYFQESYNHLALEFHNAPTSQILLYEFGLILEEIEHEHFELHEVDIVDFHAVPRLDENGETIPVDILGTARDMYQRYLARAVEHCDTYPIRILEVDKKAKALGGEGGALALRNCVNERERIR